MTAEIAQTRRRAIPSVDALLRQPKFASLWKQLGPAGARGVIREQLESLRASAGQPFAVALTGLDAALEQAARDRLRPSLRPVINATGVILHTNLGRAPLAKEAAARVAEIAGGYSNLEFDLDSGRRARRDRHLDGLLAELTGAEASIIVNNNAAAILLAVSTLACDGGEVVISRGELVEIGESFRIAEIVERSGGTLVEVGATNRTALVDYDRAIGRRTRLILRVHRSNFVMRGFVARPELRELAALGRKRRIPVIEDLGSGNLGAVAQEPTVGESLRKGASAVTYSGDKLLGGPQAGLISGKGALVTKMRVNPLFRALRADRLTYGALAATLELHARGAWSELPIAAMAAVPEAELEARARRFAAQLPPEAGAEVIAGRAPMGGGAAPGQLMRGWLVALPEVMAETLRKGEPAVVARVARGRCLLDLRTVLPAQEADLLRAVRALT
ncbi:MAG TPA: L-seryl-tRNA(Sec) selenium transferase [Terriglobales bacterium]|nr:L-seryl-tRNA(Sec) selenium transferase [Terriglobales bacterium]